MLRLLMIVSDKDKSAMRMSSDRGTHYSLCERRSLTIPRAIRKILLAQKVFLFPRYQSGVGGSFNPEGWSPYFTWLLRKLGRGLSVSGLSVAVLLVMMSGVGPRYPSRFSLFEESD